MADYINITLGDDLEDLALKLSPVNKEDQNIYFDVIPSGSTTPTLKPTEQIRILLAPHSASISSGLATTYLTQSTRKNNVNAGLYFTTIENTTTTDDEFQFKNVKLSKSWENTQFDLFWIRKINQYEEYGSCTSGTYSYPSNIPLENVRISGKLVSDDVITYNVKWTEIENSNDASYGATPTDGPYRFVALHSQDGSFADGFTDWVHYASGIMSTGIEFNLPFYNDKVTNAEIPAKYDFKLVNAGPEDLYSSETIIKMDHQALLSTDFLQDLDYETFTNPNRKQLKLIDEYLIDSDSVIDRKRMSIGVDDIAIKQNSYQKQGTYVSPYYPIDFEPYTFSLKVKELIPEYTNIEPYQVIKYYVEFNSDKWERISPITRGDEYENNVIVPKLFVFDSAPSDVPNNLKYIETGSTINVFRIKIVFDLSAVNSAQFAPPEVHDYKCLIFDKSQFFNI